MPKCKNCQREIAKTDYDICPYCGERNPLPDQYETMDVTSCVTRLAEEDLPRTKKVSMLRVLSLSCGLFGIHWFYLCRPKWGYLTLGSTLLGVSLLGTLLYFTAWPNGFVFLILLAAFWLFHALFGMLYSSRDNLKDGRGEFLR